MQKVFLKDGVKLLFGKALRLVNGPAYPVLHAVYHQLLRVVELVVARVLLPIGRQLLQQPAPAQGEPQLIVAAEVGVRADAGHYPVFLLLGPQMVVGVVRVPV